MGLLDFCIIIITLLVGFNVKYLYKNFTSFERKWLGYLFAYHLIISTVFSFYIQTNGGDATHYWDAPKELFLDQIIKGVTNGSATATILLVNYIPAKVFGLSFLTGNILYALIGYFGFIYLFLLAKTFLGNFEDLLAIKFFGLPLFTLIWFLPNLHFWSSGIGKDTLLFFSIPLFIYSLMALKTRWLGIILATLIMFLIRPHIVLFLILSMAIAFFVAGNLKLYQKVFLCVVFIGGFISIFDYVLNFVQLESFEVAQIEQYASNKAKNLNTVRAGSGVDISNYPLPFKIITFLYRPLFFDANGLFGLLASLENLILVLLTFKVILRGFIQSFKSAVPILKGVLVYCIVASVSFSLILGNLGIMMRQKNMIIPSLIIFFLWVTYNNNKNKSTIVNENTTLL